MPDILNENGLTVKTITEITDEITNDLKAIYGNDINVDQDSPDGQQINIYAQQAIDLREVLVKIYNSFDPDLAEGRILDQRVAFNGIKRSEGTFTFQDIEITIDRALNLIGLDGDASEITPTIENLYTVKDDEGNLFYLLASQSEAGAGTFTYTFRASELGKVETITNTITTAETVIAGVTNINNPNAANSTGINEETDASLRTRRKSSIALSATGYLDSIEAALNNLEGVTIAQVSENVTNATDSEGRPPHSIWAIVEGGDPDEIGAVIYAKKSSGSNMKGAEVVQVPRPDGRFFEAKYDIPVNQDLYIRFSLSLPGGVVDADSIKELIVENISWDVGGDADGSTVSCYVKSLNSNYVITGMQVSDDGASWLEVVSVSSPQNRFQNDISRITIT